MSNLRVTSLRGRTVGVSPTLPDGAVVTGVTTSTSFSGNVTGNISGGTVAGSTGTFTGDVDIADKIIHTGDTNTAIRFPANDTFTIETDGSETARFDSSHRLLLGDTSARTVGTIDGLLAKIAIETPNDVGAGLNIVWNRSQDAYGPRIRLGKSRTATVGGSTIVQNGDELGTIQFCGADGTDLTNLGAKIQCKVDGTPGSNDMPGRLVFFTSADGSGTPTERLRIDSSGRLGVGNDLTNTYDSTYNQLCIGNGTGNNGMLFHAATNGGSYIGFKDTTDGSVNGLLAYIHGTGFSFRTEGSERARIHANGVFSVGKTVEDSSTAGFLAESNGTIIAVRSGSSVAIFNRLSSDGKIVSLRQDSTEEGNISVSGSTVSYNGAHLSRWSQLPGGAERIEILRGSVLSNLDEMCEWAYDAQDAVLYTAEDDLPEGVSIGDVKTPAVVAGTENNEQLNRMKVSDTEGDKNVSGVFQDWDDDDDTYTNDFYCAMTGDFVIRIAQGTTVARGDLLMSAGDGTAKPQDDDIVRSKTIAKVTSTTVSITYSDNSYCVPCVLMAC